MFIGVIVCRNENIVRDYGLYLQYYNDADDTLPVEYSFIIISDVIRCIFNDPFFLFLVYAVLGVLLKFLAIKNLSELYFLSLVIYIGNYLLLHEFTQMRAGVSASFLLLSLPAIYNRSLKTFLLFVFLAAFFHYSALIALPLYLLNAKSINKRHWFLMLCLGDVLYFMKFDYLMLFALNDIFYFKITSYMEQTEANGNVSIFNVYYLIKTVLFLIFLLKSNLIALSNKYSYLMIKIYGISLFVYSACSYIPIISIRCSELYGIVEIIVVSYLFYIMTSKRLAIFTICLYSAITLFYRICINNIIIH